MNEWVELYKRINHGMVIVVATLIIALKLKLIYIVLCIVVVAAILENENNRNFSIWIERNKIFTLNIMLSENDAKANTLNHEHISLVRRYIFWINFYVGIWNGK